MTATIKQRLQLAGKSASTLTSDNPVPLAREIIFETDTLKAKLGDGSTAWNDLPYIAFPIAGNLVSLDTSSFNFLTGATVQAAFEQTDIALLPLGSPGVQTNSGDADFSADYGSDKRTIKLTGTITADRTVTLSTTSVPEGARFRFVRTGSGSFDWNIGAGPLKALAVDSWCDVEFDGSDWALTAYGTL